jgi:catechol 2,3-dioxygenase-like lactoylglutathione lyase family enzyme
MLKHVSHVNVWVHDQDEALEFYVGKLGLEVREDVTMAEFGDYRWLTVGPPGQPDVNLILSRPGPPMFDEEKTAELLAAVSAGLTSGAGSMIFRSDDIQATFEDLTARGVEFIHAPAQRSYGTDAAIRDPSGNAIRIVQQAPGSG